MSWITRLFGGDNKEPEANKPEPNKSSADTDIADTNIPEIKPETKPISDFTGLMRRAEWAQPLLKEFAEEVELFRRNLAYKDNWPEAHGEGRWFEAGMGRLSKSQKAEWDSNYHWMQKENTAVYKWWFENFLEENDYCNRQKIGKKPYFGESVLTIEQVEEDEQHVELVEVLEQHYDKIAAKTHDFIKGLIERAEKEQNLDKVGAKESLAKLKNIWEKLDKVMDLNQPSPERWVARKEPTAEELEPLKQEFFKLHEETEASYETLNKIQNTMAAAVKALGYKIDKKQADERNKFDNPWDAGDFDKEQQAIKENLGFPKTEHDLAREWGFHVSHVNHANDYYKELLDMNSNFVPPKVTDEWAENFRESMKWDPGPVERVKGYIIKHWGDEKALKKNLTSRHIDVMKRTLEINHRYASEQLDNFFVAITEEERVWNSGVLEKLTELKKLTAEFKQIGEIDSPSQLRQ